MQRHFPYPPEKRSIGFASASFFGFAAKGGFTRFVLSARSKCIWAASGCRAGLASVALEPVLYVVPQLHELELDHIALVLPGDEGYLFLAEAAFGGGLGDGLGH